MKQDEPNNDDDDDDDDDDSNSIISSIKLTVLFSLSLSSSLMIPLLT